MREFVGVKSPLDLLIEVVSRRIPVENVFKREALMFGRIACPQLGGLVTAFENLGAFEHPISAQFQPISAQFCGHIEYLRSQNIVFDDISSADEAALNVLLADDEFANLIDIENQVGPWALATLEGSGLGDLLARKNVTFDEMKNVTFDEMLPHIDQLPSVFGAFVVVLQLVIRKMSVQLRKLNQVDAYPVFSEFVPAIPLQTPQRNADVIDLVINALPIPDETVSWEQIIDFRSDPDSQSKFLALRNWMNEVARAEIPLNEVELKLAHLIDMYQQHMKLHRMKANVGKLQTILIASANLLDRKFTEAASPLFSARQRSLGLLEAEVTAPGKEVAFVVAARERFGTANQGTIK